MPAETQPESGDSNLSWQDVLDSALKIYEGVNNSQQSNTAVAPQIPATASSTDPWAMLKSSPAVLIGGAVALVLVLVFALKK